MLAISVFVIAGLIVDLIPVIDPEAKHIFRIVDFGICLIFLFDFMYQLIKAESKIGYLKWGWLDLVSSIPLLDYGRWARVARIARIIRLIRGVKSAKEIIRYIVSNKIESVLLATGLVTIVLLTIGSVSILLFEGGEGSNIKTGSDALWWAFVTITTVGYGDYYPVTAAGRIVAAILMIGGIGMFGAYTGYMANLFLAKSEDS
jgi:voltage-gated potassium channel